MSIEDLTFTEENIKGTDKSILDCRWSNKNGEEFGAHTIFKTKNGNGIAKKTLIEVYHDLKVDYG